MEAFVSNSPTWNFRGQDSRCVFVEYQYHSCELVPVPCAASTIDSAMIVLAYRNMPWLQYGVS